MYGTYLRISYLTVGIIFKYGNKICKCMSIETQENKIKLNILYLGGRDDILFLSPQDKVLIIKPSQLKGK